MRSKRFMTLRFPPRVEVARRLRCCDINLYRLKFHPLRQKADAGYTSPQAGCQWLIWVHSGIARPA